MESIIITSRNNEKIKSVRKLHQASARRETGLHFIEGNKLVLEAQANGAALDTVFALEDAAQLIPDCTLVTLPVMEALCGVQSVQGLCATVKTPSTACPAQYPEGFYVLLEQLQDPGNLGTILRTADAMGAEGVLLSPDSADPYSPKALRAAMGATYHLPVYVGDPETELPKLQAQGFSCICGDLSGEETLPKRGANTVLVIGNEGHGISETVAQLCYRYRMPMRGRAESLNAAIFAAIMMEKLINS